MIRLATLLLCLVFTSARADQLTVGDLYRFCTSKDQSEHNACRFYILGAFEAVQNLAATLGDRSRRYTCVPRDLTATAMEMAVRKWIESELAEYPNDANGPAAPLITAVITERFGCNSAK